MNETWLKERNSECPIPVYCPVDLKTGSIMIGLTYLGEPKGDVVGEFWYEEGEVKAELYASSKQTKRGKENV